jgi:outer membrane protein assembly factor BamB
MSNNSAKKGGEVARRGGSSVLRWIFLALCILAPVAWVMWAWMSDYFARTWITFVAPVLGVVLLAHWYLLAGRGPWLPRVRRFALFAISMVLLIVAAKLTLRYEGSAGGTSTPKFVWKWSPETRSAAAADESAVASRVEPGSALEGAADSAQFLGPKRNGEVKTSASLDWSEHPPEEMWRRPIGLGWSGFAVTGNRAVTQEQRGEEEWVSCYDLATGELLWKHLDTARFDKKMAGTGPRSTPTVAGGKVWTMGATGILNCLDLVSGEVIWSRNALVENGSNNIEWGKSTSPLVVDGMAVVTGGIDRAMVMAFDAESGDLQWKVGDDGASYASPLVATIDGVRQIVSLNQRTVTGHEVTSGAILWQWDWDDGKFPKVAQPTPVGSNRLLVTASYGAGSHLLEVKMDESASAGAVERIWQTTQMKNKFSSAMVKDGFAYGLSEGIFACIDLKDGSKVWKGGRYGFGQQLLVNGETFLVQTERGRVVLVEATPEEHREIGELEGLAESEGTSWNPPTLAGRYLLLRNDREAVCYRLRIAPE